MKSINWQTIKHIGQVKYFNISYVAILGIPLAKEIIDKFNSLHEKKIYFLPNTIVMLYFASLCYALGIALYQFFCPKIIKSHDTWQEYVRDNYDMHLMAYPDLKLQIVRTNLSKNQKETRDKIEELAKEETKEAKAELNDLLDLVLPSCLQQYLIGEYNEANGKHKVIIYLSAFFYISGTLVIAYLLFHKSSIVLLN